MTTTIWFVRTYTDPPTRRVDGYEVVCRFCDGEFVHECTERISSIDWQSAIFPEVVLERTTLRMRRKMAIALGKRWPYPEDRYI